MTFVVLHADRLTTALADDPIVPAADLASFSGALDLLAEATRVRADVEADAERARQAAKQEGHAIGVAEGRAAGAAEIRAELFRLAMQDREDRLKRQGEIATLALEVVRRIAGEVGDAEIVAGLAAKASAGLVPDTVVVVRVPPAAFDATLARLGERPGLAIEADADLAATDCVIETALGRTHGGLEVQLAHIAAAWTETRDER